MSVKQHLLNAAQRAAGRVSDRAYLSIRFRRKFGRWPALRHPRSFNEHLLDYKLSTKGDPRLPRLSDKAAVKDYVAATVGPEYVIPTIWHGPELPPRDQRNWPKPYVVKSTHGSKQIIFVRTEEDEDWDRIEAVTRKWLSTGYATGRKHREWHYDQVPRQLIVEELIGDGKTVPPDYKIFVFDGRVGLMWKDEGRYVDHKRYTFDRDWNPQPFDFYHRRGAVDPARPATLPEMIRVSEALGKGFEFVSIDLYDVNGRIYFGEMTFFPAAGNGRFFPPEGDYALGRLWPSADAKA